MRGDGEVPHTGMLGGVRPPGILPRLVLFALVATLAAPSGQERPTLRLLGPDGTSASVSVTFARGFAAVGVSVLDELGWEGRWQGEVWVARHSGGIELELAPGSPFFRWNAQWWQLVDPPYRVEGRLYVSLQLLSDFFPALLPDVYVVGESPQGDLVLHVDDPAHWRGAGSGAIAAPGSSLGDGAADLSAGRGVEREEIAHVRTASKVVIIDPGHGGRDLGAIGPGGTREKDVALDLALALARKLEQNPDMDVRLTRDSDVLVPIWRRGAWATEVKEERPGLFISIHANALPTARSTRGFETYFLSEARTEHERRVAANENAPLAIDGAEDPPLNDSDLGFILRELRNLDHQHWSALLAELIHERVARVHPGPDRGVRQAPLAVITNALMPAVLFESGYISNREEERVLAQSAFHDEVSTALALAVDDFFQRYPPSDGREGADRRRDSNRDTPEPLSDPGP